MPADIGQSLSTAPGGGRAESAGARAVARFHFSAECTEAAENAERNRISC
jgi:hypothetical protein